MAKNHEATWVNVVKELVKDYDMAEDAAMEAALKYRKEVETGIHYGSNASYVAMEVYKAVMADRGNNTYWVLWTYLANHSDVVMKVHATDPKDAVRRVTTLYSDDFQKKGKVYVFDKEPVLHGLYKEVM